MFPYINLRNKTGAELKQLLPSFLFGVQRGPILLYYSGHGEGKDFFL